MREARSRGSGKKWRKFRPHNRFKKDRFQMKKRKEFSIYSTQRSQREKPQVNLILISIFLIFIGSACYCAPEASSSDTSAMSRRSRRNLSSVESEEVDLWAQNSRNRFNRSRIYRIRAAHFNGKLAMPLQVEDSSNSKSQKQRISSATEFGARSKPAPECAEPAVAALSQTLRLSPAHKNQTQAARQLAAAASRRRPGEFEESGGGRPSGILLESLQPSGDDAGATQSEPSLVVEDYDSKITTNRTKAQLSCDSGEMILRLNFSEPFKGIVYPDHDRLSPCRFFGDGHQNYELRLPLRGCGTRQAAPRFFVNDVIVRFHKTLELEEDEVKTLICRYPPPLAPIPTEPLLFNKPNNRPFGEQENGTAPFELLDFGKVKQSNAGNEPASIETLSENLVVAPSGAGGYPNGFNRFNQPTISNRETTNVITADQFSSRISQKNPQAFNESALQQGSSFLERLSSIELLFLISSLMFLILLTLGLIVSYYCFKRQSAYKRRRSVNQRANAILKRNQRFAGALVGPAAAGGPQYQPRTLQSAAPSSPESDLSGRGLLNATNYAMYNRAYVPDNPAPAHYIMPASSFGRDPSLGRARRERVLNHSTGAKPVVGRRDTIYGYKHYQQQPNVVPRQRHHFQTLLRPAYSEFPINDVTTSNSLKRVSNKEPLIALSPEQTNTLKVKSSRVNDPQYSLVHKPSKQQQLYRAQHVYLGPGSLSRAKSLSSMDDKFEIRGESYSSESSDAECLNNNELNNNKSKLLLKRIEDSYITNYTEIQEQEYTKRDSTKPLSMSEWRSLQPNQSVEPNRSGRSSPPSSDDDETNRYKSNLRSLTELDVNFAKSLQTKDEDSANKIEAPAEAPVESPDLILSPDYDHTGARQQRLELEQPEAGSVSSHNSVSYV